MLRALQETGSFSVLTANVAGLPAIISSGNPAANSVELGRRINEFDIVNVQEDFNYHSDLLSANTHPFRTEHSGGVPFGSGLNTLSRFKFTDVANVNRIKWNKCSTFDGADCLTPKGFTFLQAQIADGVSVDIYNLHADAGTTDADLDARRNNINQITDYILANSKDQPVIVFGDTNTRYTRTGDNVRDIVARAGLTDAWVANTRNGVPPGAGADALACGLEQTTNACEVVDKIFFRGNRLLNLNLLQFNTELTKFQQNGKSLSDHVPLSSTFSWTLNPALRQSVGFGGPHGSFFTDIGSVPVNQRVTSVSVRGGSRVDAVSITVGGVTFAHGGTGGTLQTLNLNAGEFVRSVELHSGQKDGRTRIFYAKFTTSSGRTVAAGGQTSNRVTYTAPAGWQIAAFHGRKGSEVDSLGVIYTRVV